MRQLLKISILALCVGLAGCDKPFDRGGDGINEKAEPDFKVIPKAIRQKRLASIRHWRMFGAFDVRAHGKDRIINFNWYQKGPKVFVIRLNTAGGFYQVSLKNYHGRLTFWRTPTRFIRTTSFRNLMLSEVGWYVPFNEFYYWIRDIPLPKALSKGKVVKKFDKYGHLVVLGQNGWVLHYEDFRTYFGHDMPTRISVFGEHVKFEIAITQWILYFNQDLMDIPKTNEILLKSL